MEDYLTAPRRPERKWREIVAVTLIATATAVASWLFGFHVVGPFLVGTR